ncbi:hypothetical protein MRB53_001997 [Persea americana]|uniref:Uncharacterized protein n=1 Tax=Persea americana TaxID=3435 RepID=A0ACC2MUV7_PERAE|nr:hypothetical protein MRB53_001997 [Persea americana]
MLPSSKWWPGGLGNVSTHAVIYAHLITEGPDHGVDGFIVQLLSLDNHLPLSGITIVCIIVNVVRRQFGSQGGGPESQVINYKTQQGHAYTIGLTSPTTITNADRIEECQELCGGHGYVCSNGHPELFDVYIIAHTYEGDTTVLLLQVASFLMKTVSQLVSENQLDGTTT